MKSSKLFPNILLLILRLNLLTFQQSLLHLLRMFFKLPVLMFASIPSLVPQANLSQKYLLFCVHMLKLLLILILLLFQTTSLTLSVIFNLYFNYTQLISINLTISTIHVNDFLKKLVLLETPSQFTSS